MDTIGLTVVYDNYLAGEGLQTAHGFACVIQTGDEVVLFDTGSSGQVLLQNMDELGIDPLRIGAAVLSHMHWDHTGGLDAVLAVHPGMTVYAPAAFSSLYLEDLRPRAGAVVETTQSRRVAGHLCTTDVIEDPLVEQAVYVRTADGIVVITGCAHPGVVELARSAQRTSGEPIDAVLGGFHMLDMSPAEIARVIADLKELGVRRAGPCHCSGDATRDAMREAFGDTYLDIGVGTRLSFPAPDGG